MAEQEKAPDDDRTARERQRRGEGRRRCRGETKREARGRKGEKREIESSARPSPGSTEKAAGVGWMDFQPRIDNNCLNQALVEAAPPPQPPSRTPRRRVRGGGRVENEAKDKGASRSSNRAEHGVSTSPRWRCAATSIQGRLP